MVVIASRDLELAETCLWATKLGKALGSRDISSHSFSRSMLHIDFEIAWKSMGPGFRLGT
jgi:hypothetical protein